MSLMIAILIITFPLFIWGKFNLDIIASTHLNNHIIIIASDMAILNRKSN